MSKISQMKGRLSKMAEKAVDSRVRRTKRLLKQGLTELMAQKSIKKITVRELSELVDINRGTFYLHYKDIYDLVEWCCLEDARRALENKTTHDTWQEGFLRLFEVVLDNKPFVMNVYRCVHREQVERYLKPQVDSLVMGVLDEQSENITVRQEDKEFIAQVYSYVFVGLMLDWIKDDMKADPKLIVDKLAILMKDSLADALRRFRI